MSIKSWHFAGQGILVDDEGEEHALSTVYNDSLAGRLIEAAPELRSALQLVLPLAEAYLRSAPTHSDNAKLQDARDALDKVRRKHGGKPWLSTKAIATALRGVQGTGPSTEVVQIANCFSTAQDQLDAGLFRMIADSPRFRQMKVADVLWELARNGFKIGESRVHWPDCALNHGGTECDMGPDCGSDKERET